MSFNDTSDRSVIVRLRASSTDAAGATDYIHNGLFQYGGTSGILEDTTSGISVGDFSNTVPTGSVEVSICNPNLNVQTQFLYTRHAFQDNVSDYVYLTSGGAHKVDYQADGFSLISTSGTFSGSLTVYGLAK
jgi:hypothetical protein